MLNRSGQDLPIFPSLMAINAVKYRGSNKRTRSHTQAHTLLFDFMCPLQGCQNFHSCRVTSSQGTTQLLKEGFIGLGQSPNTLIIITERRECLFWRQGAKGLAALSVM